MGGGCGLKRHGCGVATVFGCAGERVVSAVVSAQLFEEETAGSLLEAMPLCGWRGEVGGGVLAWLGDGLDGGDGPAVGAELRTRAGAVVRVLGLGWLGLGLCGVALVFGEVGGGELESVKGKAGAAEVDVVAGDAGDDAAEAFLYLGAGVGGGHVESVAAGLALAGVGDGTAGEVMVVAEALAAHGG